MAGHLRAVDAGERIVGDPLSDAEGAAQIRRVPPRDGRENASDLRAPRFRPPLG